MIISALLFIACDSQPPIPEDKFIKVYVDLLIVQDTTTTENYTIDSVKSRVLEKYGFTTQQYDKTIRYYNSQPEKWVVFYDSVTVYVERLKKKAENQP